MLILCPETMRFDEVFGARGHGYPPLRIAGLGGAIVVPKETNFSVCG
jgi:hypothetical protein